MGTQFTDVIRTEDDLRVVIPEPANRAVWDKTITILDRHCRDFIAKSPFLLLATCDSTGRVDVSPKGDPPGFVQVLDDTTLAIPDRPGNQRADSLRNLVDRPRAGLIFLVPGKSETLRVNGPVELVRDRWLLEQMAMKGKPAQLAIVVHAEEVFFHCSKCVVRSQLWEQSAWPDLSDLASMGQVMKDHIKLDLPEDAMNAFLEQDVKTRLY